MKMPPPPRWLPTHRHNGRLWDTRELVELLIVRFGATSAAYPRTRDYRALIDTIRLRNSTNSYRKGYALDWRGLKWEEKEGKRCLVKEKEAPSIKSDIAEYLKLGRIPASVLSYVCEHLREAEVRVWADNLVRARTQRTTLEPHLAEAAE